MKWLIVILAILIILPAVLERADALDSVQNVVSHIIGNVPLLLTRYDVMEGGINCDSDCSDYANGEKVLSSHYWNGSTGVAACPRNWLNRTVVIDGIGIFHCKDRGGAIVATESYIRIDLLSKVSPPCDFVKDINGDRTAECFVRNWTLR